MNKKIIYIIFFLLIFNMSFSQEYLKFDNIDTAIFEKNIEIKNSSNIIIRNNSILDLVDLYRIKGDYSKALSVLESANTKNINIQLKTRLLDLKGLILFNYSDIEEAKLNWDKSYRIKDIIYDEDSSIYASTYLYYSMYYMYINECEKALYYSKRAINIAKQGDNILNAYCYRNYTYANKIDIINNEKLFATNKTQVLLTNTISICKKYNYNFYLSRLYQDYGNMNNDKILSLKQKNNLQELNKCYKNAHYYYNLSIGIRNRCFGKNTELNGLTWYVKGLLEYYLGNLTTKEIDYYNNAINCYYSKYDNELINNIGENINNQYQVLEILQYKISALLKRYTLKKDSSYLHQAYKDVNLSINLWQYILKHYKSNEISKVLSPYNTMPFNNAINTYYELYKLTNNKQYLNDIFKFSETEKQAVFYRNIGKRYSNSENKRVITLNQVQNKLNPKEAIIEYSEKHILFITKDTFLLKNITKRYIRYSDSLLLSIQSFNINKFTNYSYKLYEELIYPIKDNLQNINRITIIPYYKIELIPFDCLIQSKPDINTINYKSLNYLINNYEISYAYSASMKYQTNSNSWNNKIYMVSPKFNKNETLPFSKKLINNISNNYENKYIIDNDTNLLTDINNYSIIHLATHTNLNNDDNAKSKIIIGKNNKSIKIENFYKHKINSQLAVVLACESAIGDIYRGDQTNSFVRAFKYAGVPSVISTLWKVDDKTSNEILQKFYYNLIEKNNNISIALHNAKKEHLACAKSDEDFNPYYWAGIIFTGSDIKINIKKKVNYTIITFSIIGIVLMLIVLMLIFKTKISVSRKNKPPNKD